VNKKEFMAISIGLKAAYPRFTFLSTNEEMEFWYQLLQDIDYSVAHNGVLEHISTNIFPPSIAEIRELCTKRMFFPIKSFDDAWGDVVKAISAYGGDKPFEAYDTMDELTVGIVKNIGWYNICTSENPDTIRANFRMAYEAKAKEKQKNYQLPSFVAEQTKQLIEQNIPLSEKIEQNVVPAAETAKPIEQNAAHPEVVSEKVAELKRRLQFGKKE